MPWVRIDDHFDEHPKLAAVGPLGWGVWLAGIAYCNRNLTDGFIPRAKAHSLASFETVDEEDVVWSLSVTSGMQGEDIDVEWVIDLLLRAGIWDQVPGGYRIHDYEDFQPTKAQVLAEREQKRAAGKAGGEAAAKARAKRGAKQPPEQNDSDSSTNGVAESNPVPVPNPVPKPVSVPSEKPSPLPPLRGGTRAEKTNPRANGTNPRAVAARKREERIAAAVSFCDHGLSRKAYCEECEAEQKAVAE